MIGFSMRAATRVRSELMAAVYYKALTRKDFSGIVDKDKAGEVKAKGDAPKSTTREAKAKAKAEEQKANDPKAGAGSHLLLLPPTPLDKSLRRRYWEDRQYDV
jgi:hypothetical protein